MPRKQDLSQATIYHIRHMETKEVVYVGSSCNFTQRQRSHKYSCYDETAKAYNVPIYVYIREQGGFDLFEVVPVSFHTLKHEVELRILEQNEMDKYPNAYNKYKAYISKTELAQQKKEYYENKKEHLTQKAKEWREANKEHHTQQMKERYEKNKAEIKQKVKEYYEANKEHLAQQRKERYEKNKAEINAKVECPCCKKMTIKQYLSRHQKRKACVLAELNI